MAESDGQERTEDATPRRLQQAREKGQVARSKELASVAVLVSGAVGLMWFGEMLAVALSEVMRKFFTLSREEVFDFTKLLAVTGDAIVHMLWPLLLVLIFLFVAALIGASALGGISFSAEAARPKLSRMNRPAALNV